MDDGTEEAILRELDSQTPTGSETPDRSAQFEQTLRSLARLAQLMEEDVDAASDAPESELNDALREIERKAHLLSQWLLSKADEYGGASSPHH